MADLKIGTTKVPAQKAQSSGVWGSVTRTTEWRMSDTASAQQRIKAKAKAARYGGNKGK